MLWDRQVEVGIRQVAEEDSHFGGTKVDSVDSEEDTMQVAETVEVGTTMAAQVVGVGNHLVVVRAHCVGEDSLVAVVVGILAVAVVGSRVVAVDILAVAVVGSRVVVVGGMRQVAGAVVDIQVVAGIQVVTVGIQLVVVDSHPVREVAVDSHFGVVVEEGSHFVWQAVVEEDNHFG